MTTFTDVEIHRGVGAFEQAMRTQSVVPGVAPRLSPSTAIGILAAAMSSEMPAALIDQLPETSFAPNAVLLKRVLEMYEGDDWDIKLWHRLPTGKYKLCTDLRGLVKPGWRYDRNAGQDGLD